MRALLVEALFVAGLIVTALVIRRMIKRQRQLEAEKRRALEQVDLLVHEEIDREWKEKR